MKKVLCCMCFIFILLFFSSCVTQVNNQSDSISTMNIPHSLIRFCGLEQDEFIESISSNHNDIYTEVKAEGEDVVVSMTESQKQNLIKQTEQIIDNSLEDYYNFSPEYRFYGSNDYKKVEFYHDEHLRKLDEEIAILKVASQYAQMQLLMDDSEDWSVEVKVYNCHTGKLVAEATVPHDHFRSTSEDWTRSYE